MISLQKITICIFICLHTTIAHCAEVDKKVVTVELNFGKYNENFYTISLFMDNVLKDQFNVNAYVSPRYTSSVALYPHNKNLLLAVSCLALGASNDSNDNASTVESAFHNYTFEEMRSNQYQIYCFVPSLMHNNKSDAFINDVCKIE